MRICFVSAGPFAHVGPYLEYFQQAGHEVHFLALSPSPPRPVRVHELAVGARHAAEYPKWKYPLSMLRARRLVRALRPDVVHAHYATSGGLAGLVCGHRPTVVTAHGTDLSVGARSAVWRPLLRAVFQSADRVHTVSEELRALALELGVPAAKLEVLTPGIETARFLRAARRTPERGRAVRLVSTRRFEPVYDHETVLEALDRLRRRGVRFEMTFAGDGSGQERARRSAAERGLGGCVRFVGAVSQEALPQLLAGHDVYLSASRRDGTSLSLLEAMAAGLFPIVSDIPANRAWLADGAGGALHRPGDPEDLAARIVRFAETPEVAARAAELNRRRVEAGGDRSTNMRRLEAVYRELVEGAVHDDTK